MHFCLSGKSLVTENQQLGSSISPRGTKNKSMKFLKIKVLGNSNKVPEWLSLSLLMK